MLVDVEVDHPGDERPLEPGEVATQDVEAAAGNLHTAREVDESQFLGDFPVRLDRKIERARLTPMAHDDVAALVGADRNIRIGQIGNLKQQCLEPLLDRSEFPVELLDTVAELAHGGDSCLSVGARWHLADPLRFGIALRLELFDLGDQLASPFVELEDLVDRCFGIEFAQGFTHEVRLFANQPQVEHLSPFGNQRTR
ncbi:hypothetical protein HRbin27_01813 [bacterium HR27]|nr:hypothetical protein HRbin27_01813 [bacterium HR27]